MRITTAISLLVFFCQITMGQDTLSRYEFGSTLVTVNSFNSTNYSAPDRPAIEFINGVFFRYSNKRYGFRAHTSYSENAVSYASPPEFADASSGDISSKDLRIGIGGQYTLCKRCDKLYVFGDLSYRNLFSTGHNYGGITGANHTFSRTGNGFDFFSGLGIRMRIFKSIMLTPELGYLISTQLFDARSTSLTSGSTATSHYNEVNTRPAIKVHMTVRF